jgi:DNA-binding NarL/FixJ family response regulator
MSEEAARAPPRVVIADDHPLVSGALARTLAEAGYAVVATAADGIAALAAIRRHRPDLAILDLGLPLAHGAEVFAEARRWSPATRFVILTGSAAPGLLATLAESGAQAIFLKTDPVADLLAALPRVLGGETLRSAAVAALIAGGATGAGLTARELQVLHGIAAGETSLDLAERLAISAKTVENHRASLMRKLDVHSTASLIMTAIRRGLIDAPGRDLPR